MASAAMLRAMAADAILFSDEDAARAARWLAAWDGQGTHRTGTAGGMASAAWLTREVAEIAAPRSIDVSMEEWPLDRLDPVAAFVEIGGERIEGVPVFDAPLTEPDGISGQLGPVGGDAEIAVAELPPGAVYNGEFERLRRSGDHRGFIVVCRGDNPGLGLLNAESFRRPYGAPAIHVSSEACPRVRAAAAERAPARLVSYSRRVASRAFNLVVTLPGPAGATPLVVMTPRSSWWQSTAERGGGIVCWLETLRMLLGMPLARPVVFTANSGHELGHLGLDDFVARRPGWDRSAAAGGATWVHYGANIGAAGGALSLVSPDDALRDLGAAELARAGQPVTVAPKELVPSGETRDIHRAGGRYLTLVGTSRWFHLPQDRWPYSVDVAAITRTAAASARIARALAQQ